MDRAPAALRSVRALLLGAAALPVAACSGERAPAVASGGTAVVCLAAEPAGLNAFTSPDQAAADLVPVLFTPLVQVDDEGRVAPWLAEGWSWDASHHQLTFTLRGDVTWHDGRPVTAEDVAWTLATAADTAFGYWSAEDFLDVSAVRVAGDREVVVEFASPTAGSVEAFAALPILPRHLLAALTPEQFGQAPYHRAPVGSGPFRFVQRRSSGETILERWTSFPEALAEPRLARIVLRAIPERSTQLVELSAGSVHACVLGGSAADQVRTAGLESVAVGPFGVHALPLRNDRAPFDDVRVRRAVSAALDRREIAGVLSSVASPAANFLPADNRYRDAALNQRDADPALAAALLDSAGWNTIGRDGIRRNAAGRTLSFRLVAPPSFADPLTVVQAQLRRVGFDVQLELLEASTYVATIQDPERRPPAMALIMTPTKVDFFDPFAELHSEGYANFAGYHSTAVDSLVDALRTAFGERERADIYRRLQQSVRDDVPAIYTAYVPRLVAHGPALEGVSASPQGPFASIAEWSLRGR